MARTTQRSKADHHRPDCRDEVVARFVGTGTPVAKLAEEFGLREETVREWIRRAAEDVVPGGAAGLSATGQPAVGDDLGGLYEMITAWAPEDEVVDNAANANAAGDELYETGSWTGDFDDSWSGPEVLPVAEPERPGRLDVAGDPELQAEVVAWFLGTGAPVADVAQRFNLDEQRVREWIRHAAASAAPVTPPASPASPAPRTTAKRSAKRATMPAKPVAKRTPKQVAKRAPKPIEKPVEQPAPPPPAVEAFVPEAPVVEVSASLPKAMEAPAVEVPAVEAATAEATTSDLPAVDQTWWAGPDPSPPTPDGDEDDDGKTEAWAALVQRVYLTGTADLFREPEAGTDPAPTGEPKSGEVAARASSEELPRAERRWKPRWPRRGSGSIFHSPTTAESADAPLPAALALPAAPQVSHGVWARPTEPLTVTDEPEAAVVVEVEPEAAVVEAEPEPAVVSETPVPPQASDAARAAVERLISELAQLPTRRPAERPMVTGQEFQRPQPNPAAAWQPDFVVVLEGVKAAAPEANQARLRDLEARRAWTEMLDRVATLELLPGPAVEIAEELTETEVVIEAETAETEFAVTKVVETEVVEAEVVDEPVAPQPVEDVSTESGARWVEAGGWTLAHARQAALDQLGVDDADACIEVLQPDGLRRVRSRVHVRARLRTTGSPGEATPVPAVIAPARARRPFPMPGEWIEASGRTEAEAREAALDQLGVDDADAEVEVVNRDGGRLRRRVHVRARVRCDNADKGEER